MESRNRNIDLRFYHGSDLYSDGDIENEILEIVETSSDYREVLARDHRWPLLYHLTPNRRNLLEWYDFRRDAHLLEIGAGCGALTGLFCERVSRVTAVELSRRRAEIISARHRDKENLEIIAGNLADIRFDSPFDYVTLIGVLEYAAKYGATKNPYQDFLSQVRKYLKPDGVLIIAIENKFGLKYWAGCREDHTGRFFDSLENYPHDLGIRTFGKDELQQMLHECGFGTGNFYYPVPDYKIPVQIFSDAYLPELGQIETYYPNFDNDRIVVFDEKLVIGNLIQNKRFDWFANSFLVFCRFGEGI